MGHLEGKEVVGGEQAAARSSTVPNRDKIQSVASHARLTWGGGGTEGSVGLHSREGYADQMCEGR